MKNILKVLLIIFIASSCKKEVLAPTEPINEMVDTTAMIKYSGSFVNGPFGKVSGKAEVYIKGSTLELKLADFNSTNGPALRVYLSKEPMPVSFVDLGELKSTNGNQVYGIKGMPDFTEYKYISIHCVAYNHLFGSALLK